MNVAADTTRYFAFLSYSHEDKRWADWLHKALETYRVPRRLVGLKTATGVIPRRLLPIFRDRDELATGSDLSVAIESVLANSNHLIVICSPHAARSRWVNEEVLVFKRLGRDHRVLCLVVDGEPNASTMPGREVEECIPPALRASGDTDSRPTRHHAEPVAADVRPGKDGRTNAKLRLIAGMLDVGFDALKQREHHRQIRRLTAVAAGAMLVTLLTAVLAIRAVIARGDAERQQKNAENLVGFMLGDLNDKLQQVSRLDVMESVDNQAMRYFESLPTKDVTDAALAQRANALEKIATVRMNQGHLPDAIESYQAAAKLTGSLADAAPADPARQVAHSRVLTYIGLTAWYQGRLDEAQQRFEAAQAVLTRAELAAAKDPQLIFQMTVVENNIGHVLEARGKIDEAELRYRSMLAHCRLLVSDKTASTEWTVQLGAAHNNLGKIALMRGDLATAVAEYAADDTIEAGLTARDPKNNEQRGETLRVRAIFGRTLTLTGDIEAGTLALQQAVDIAIQLVAIDPTRADVQAELARYSAQLSRLKRLGADLRGATALMAKSHEIYLALSKQSPDNADLQNEYAEAQTELAAQSLAAGRVDEARAQAQVALGILDPAFSKMPGDRAILLATTGAKLLLANVSATPATALQLRRDALTAMQPAAASGDPRVQALEAEALLALGRAAEAQQVVHRLWDTGYRDLGLLAVLQRHHVDYPLNAAFKQRLQAAIAQTNNLY